MRIANVLAQRPGVGTERVLVATEDGTWNEIKGVLWAHDLNPISGRDCTAAWSRGAADLVQLGSPLM